MTVPKCFTFAKEEYCIDSKLSIISGIESRFGMEISGVLFFQLENLGFILISSIFANLLGKISTTLEESTSPKVIPVIAELSNFQPTLETEPPTLVF